MTKRLLTIIFALFALAFNMRGQSADYRGTPWVTNTSRPYAITRGLEGRHLSLWASHGRYFDATKNTWRWQRPNLFCTTEDLLTQSFVNPYLSKMLENAGAIVFMPRERDSQMGEAIVDNDTPGHYGSYAEYGHWKNCGRGFGLNFKVLNDTVQPFLVGSSRAAAANSGASATWTPDIPETGEYAVYVSYTSLPTSIDDARYIVHHAGGETTFSVNQQMGGGTWVYLGTFRFEAGQNKRNAVVLTADSKCKGKCANGEAYTVTADAVRFGGGFGLAERSVPTVTQTFSIHPAKQTTPDGLMVETTVTDTINHYVYGKGERSGLPRFLEGARYYTQFAGLADTLFCRGKGTNDYNDDLRARSYMMNLLTGGSCYLPDTIGLKVPIELQFALHTDAGHHSSGDLFGAMGIATDYDDNACTTYRSGLTRDAAISFADNMLKGVSRDLSTLYSVKWPERELRVKNYAETRSPMVPSTILELLSHQNFRDMTYAHDPNFRFNVSRAIYKVLLREVYRMHDLGEPIVQPLPVHAFSAVMSSTQPHLGTSPYAIASVALSWLPTVDPLEPSATPTDYVLYIRQGDDDWDAGTLTDGETAVNVSVRPGTHYQFRVAAVNAGGISMPSEPLSVYVAPEKSSKKKADKAMPTPTLLLVNGFDRLSGPARIETAGECGFDLAQDVGVAAGSNTSLCGAQTVFSRAAGGKEGPGALGYSGTEYEGIAIAGNRFDGVALHTADILSFCKVCNIVSMSREAFEQMPAADLRQYQMIDYIAGLQADKPYNLRHYDLFNASSRRLLADYASHGGKLLVSGAFIGEASATGSSNDELTVADNDSVFLSRVLHCTYRATIGHRERPVFSGLGINLPAFNLPGAVHYPCQQSAVLEPSSTDAFSAFAYAPKGVDGYSAGVAWPRGVVMGFPYDCITDSAIRQKVMYGVFKHLFPKPKQ